MVIWEDEERHSRWRKIAQSEAENDMGKGLFDTIGKEDIKPYDGKLTIEDVERITKSIADDNIDYYYTHWYKRLWSQFKHWIWK